MSKTFCYSTDEERYDHDSIHDCIDDFEVGEEVVVYRGVRVKKVASDFSFFSIDMLEECAYDRAGDFAEYWPAASTEQGDDCVKMVNEAIDAWATKHNKHPNFYGVKNVQKIFLTVLPDGEYTITKGNDN